ncbi:MAG: serine protein kinase RIO, partial [Pseudomonas sp.]
MKTPKRIEPLVEDGLVDEVIRPLMSGKEAA